MHMSACSMMILAILDKPFYVSMAYLHEGVGQCWPEGNASARAMLVNPGL